MEEAAMQRGSSNWWLLLLWLPLLALVPGLIAGCASIDTNDVPARSQPTRAELRQLVAQELDADSRFDSFGASASTDARSIAAVFRPVLADVKALVCRVAPAASLDC